MLKLSETGFRPLYHNFCVFPLNDTLNNVMKDYPDIKDANCILTYGYIDKDAGLTLEVLACGILDENGARFADPDDSVRIMVRAGKILNDGFHYLEPDEILKKRYAGKLEIVKLYDADDELEKTRELGFLDELRHPEHPDDVRVYLLREGLQQEQCWVRLVGVGDHCLIGDLLNEPYQKFDYHKGDRIAFGVQETDENELVCVADVNPSFALTAENLEGGEMLRDAITAFNQERNQDNFFDVLALLRDSYVWIPCNAVMGDADVAYLETIVNQAGDDLESLKGLTFKSKEDTRFIPDILQNGDDYFFPVFTSCEVMGEYGEHFSKIEVHFLDAINRARHSEKDVVGIVIDAFSEPFVLETGVFDLVEGLKSNITDTTEE